MKKNATVPKQIEKENASEIKKPRKDGNAQNGVTRVTEV